MTSTITDIAKAANVSHSTVSRALNDSPLVSEQTRTRIKELARTMDYVPNYAARNLVAKQSGNILLLASSAIDAYPASFLYEIMDGVNQSIPEAYTLVFRKVAPEHSQYRPAPSHCDAVIFVCLTSGDLEILISLAQSNLPLVVLNRDTSDMGIPCAFAGEYAGVQAGVNHLIALGHRRIAHIQGPSEITATYLRSSAFINTLRQHRIDLPPDYVQLGHFTPEGGFKAMSALLSLPEPPTAVFAANDLTAVGALKACAARGVSVPGDISVLGFDDMEFSQYLIPSLTTVAKNKREIGRAGGALMAAIMTGGHCEPTLPIELKLIARESCGAPA